MYITLRRGDRLPIVAAAQSMLNRTGLAGIVAVDGHFGDETLRAVRQFQRARHLPERAELDTDTWRDLASIVPYQAIDSIDAGHIEMWLEDLPYLAAGGEEVVSNFGMSVGVPHVMRQIRASARLGSVVLLRFDGHGRPGRTTLAKGLEPVPTHDSVVDSRAFGMRAREAWGSLRSIFAPCGSIELHGCNAARGPWGHLLLTTLAEVCGVPVTAGLRTQYGAGMSDRFEGPTVTACPRGVSLRQWAAGWSASLTRDCG